MKRYIRIIYSLISLIILIQLSSCEDYLDRQPLDQYGEEAIWSDPAMMEHFVNNIYWYIGHSFDRPMIGVFTDESMFDPGSDQGHGNVVKSLITPSDYGVFDTWNRTQKMRWEHHYKYIRACNLFLDQIEGRTYENEEYVKRLTGEVYFLRAYHYHNLVFLYGGAPIIEHAYGLSDDFLAARNTFEECINFIVGDCDKAAELLPLTEEGSNFGRATKGAAMALKARVLLYAASDLYNSDASWTNGYEHPALVGYVGGDRNNKWVAAKNAAKSVIDLGMYSLYKAEPSPGDSVAQNYDEVFTSKQTVEDIFIRNFTESNQHWTMNIGQQNLPAGYKGWANVSPINSMVDDFEMADGTKFDWNNPVHKANPYGNREPRFYVDIFYDGAKWRQRPDDVIAADPIGIIQTGNYEQADGTWVGGLDALSNPVTTWNGTYTSYYLRKFQNISVDAPKVVTTTPWRFIRYAEILLSYAEACVELEEYGEARKYINIIRKRAGLPEVDASDNELRDKLRHERKIELMFEDQRFFDIRRWMIAPEVIVDAYGLDIKYFYGDDKPSYEIIHVQERDWKDRFYFFPIKLDEMNRNELLIQNPLY
ncbi:RagB/SusD family nutrient uptake outer membrane protein [Maribellus maritimus]|uniref:RagB/SusD family nutrient uptake outer membrane protein n=1 Tax=Maribellus maritimus TaxID=2870838 RepID=UPI001EEB33B5|nr:RagB/SusD family nutrient uptake outer membrane protein [Maribellus maritimus]MCG6187994.1 RagB/SusD family nutrient uptake outer membrane protein [Maribellus maritimus]